MLEAAYLGDARVKSPWRALLIFAAICVVIYSLFPSREQHNEAVPINRGTPAIVDSGTQLRGTHPGRARDTGTGSEAGVAHPTGRDKTPGAPNGTLFVGRVVNSDDVGVGGAHITARHRGKTVAETTTDRRGEYSFRFLRVGSDDNSAAGIIGARDGRGHRGQTSFYPDAAGVDAKKRVRLITLHASTTLRLRVLTPDREPTRARVWLVPPHMFASAPLRVLDTDARGLVAFADLSRGLWRVVAAGVQGGRSSRLLRTAPNQADVADVVLGRARRLAIQVCDRDDNTPVANARVRIYESMTIGNRRGHTQLHSQPTEHACDAQGRCVVQELGGTQELMVRAIAEGYPGATGTQTKADVGAIKVKPDETDVTILLARGRELRWKIIDAGHGIPPDGSTVRLLEPARGKRYLHETATIDAGDLVVRGLSASQVWAHAVVPAFGVADVLAPPRSPPTTDDGKEEDPPALTTSFHPLRKAELLVQDAAGRPLAGIYFLASGVVTRHAVTGPDGRAVIRNLFGTRSGTAFFDVSRSRSDAPRFALGGYQMYDGDVSLTHTFPPKQRLVLKLMHRNDPVQRNLDGTLFFRSIRKEFVVGDDGEVTLDIDGLTTDSRGRITVQQNDGIALSGSFAVEDENADTAFVRVDLIASLVVRLDVLGPGDGVVSPGLQRWNEALDDWDPEFLQRGFTRSDGFATIRNVAPGRYRALDRASGLASDPFDVSMASSPVQVILDARRASWVRGTLLRPKGVRTLRDFHVGIERKGMLIRKTHERPRLPGVRVDPNSGAFSIRVHGKEPVTIRAYHHTYIPHALHGRARVVGGETDVRLQVIPGPRARITPDPSVSRALLSQRGNQIPVMLYPRGGTEQPLARLARLDTHENEIVFGNYEPGRYDIWIDTWHGKPLRLENIELKSGETQLGTHKVARGSRLRVIVNGSDDVLKRVRLSIMATSVDAPHHKRTWIAEGPSPTLQREWRVAGLGAGRYEVSVWQTGYGSVTGELLRETIAFDGEHEVVRTLDVK